MSATPAAGWTLNASSIGFTLQRSGTGIRQYSVRGSGESFAQNLAASIVPANPNLSIVASPEPNIFQVTDTTTTANAGSRVTLNPRYSALTWPVTFRFHGFNAEGTSGTFSVDNVTIYGLVSAGGVPVVADVTADEITTSAATLTGTLNPNGAATTWYVLYGPTAQYGNVSPSQILPAGIASVPITQALTGLRSYTIYHYQIVAANSTGLFLSADQTFGTAAGDRDSDGMPDDWEAQHGLDPDDVRRRRSGSRWRWPHKPAGIPGWHGPTGWRECLAHHWRASGSRRL